MSEADRASEAYIVSELHRARPGDALLSEEGASHDGTTKVSWVADPLDGTTNFFYQVPAYSVSLAACYEGDPVVGVVVDPSRHETWSAAQGRGAWCNDVACHVASGRSQLDTALVGTGFSYRRENRVVQAAMLAHLLPRRTGHTPHRFGRPRPLLGRQRPFRRLLRVRHCITGTGPPAASSARRPEASIATLPGDIVLASTPELLAPLTDLLAQAQAEAPAARP